MPGNGSGKGPVLKKYLLGGNLNLRILYYPRAGMKIAAHLCFWEIFNHLSLPFMV